jgi:hypothetical protein
VSELTNKIMRSVHSGESGIWIYSDEQAAAIDDLVGYGAGHPDMHIVFWDVVNGPRWEAGKGHLADFEAGASILDVFEFLQKVAGWRADLNPDELTPETKAKKRAIETDQSIHPDIKDHEHRIVVVLRNGHLEFKTQAMRELVTGTALLIERGKIASLHLLFLVPPTAEPPAEIAKLVLPIHHPLPDQAERAKIIQSVWDTDAETLVHISEVTSGLTRAQTESAVATSAQIYSELNPKFIGQRKMELINKSSALALSSELIFFDPKVVEVNGVKEFVPGIGGLHGIKNYVHRVFASKHKKARPRGMILVGVPGTGKSALAKSMGNEMGWPTLRLDMSALVTGTYGGTENAMRQVLDIADAMSPAMLYIDEAEKAFAGVASSNQTDGGTTARMFGKLLEWLNDHTSSVYTMLTCNDISNFPAALLRAGRFDVKVFVDVPTDEQRESIWAMYITYFGLNKKLAGPSCKNWTGAEVKSCCEQAAMLECSLEDAAAYVQPIVETDPNGTDALRNWARSHCLDAETGRRYGTASATAQTVAVTGARRTVTKG